MTTASQSQPAKREAAADMRTQPLDECDTSTTTTFPDFARRLKENRTIPLKDLVLAVTDDNKYSDDDRLLAFGLFSITMKTRGTGLGLSEEQQQRLIQGLKAKLPSHFFDE